MWIRCVESRPNESKFDPASQKRPRHFSPARNGSLVLGIHDPTSEQFTRTRDGSSQPACAFSVAPVRFQMPTLTIFASPTRFRRFRFQRTCTFSTHPMTLQTSPEVGGGRRFWL
ncbi:hypothetical protein PAXRUDRAFT_836145 [Paxillus rubicundulus Ve08.2h10]|uniref:Uncharacterized protein n=1 Tax=Paxillus rubicundulus Ve08.2h10 TaxID=930991 RepID=A0A0D0CE96_9AGAM|nr:hypothetical protein PAXRUDRAFT_836145 [Paxillus rubicundulus Ve08.2h10]